MRFRIEKFKNPHFSHKDRDSAVKKQRKSGIYEKSVKKEGCEFARNAVLSKNVLPLYIFDSRFMQAKRKCLNTLVFHACYHIKRFFFYFAFTAESLVRTARLVFIEDQCSPFKGLCYFLPAFNYRF